MNNLIEIQSQIEKLTKQASEIRAREFDKTVLEILEKMTAFGITLKDLTREKAGNAGRRRANKTLGPGSTSKSKSKRLRGPTGVAVAAKFRGPNGETWSGRGLTPRWLAALVATGKNKEEFSIKS